MSANALSTLVQGLAVLPDAHRRPSMPEKRLQAAVMRDAIDCYVSDSQPLALSAERWIENDDGEAYPFSFVGICDSLGLDIDAVRQTLRKRRDEITCGLGRNTCVVCGERSHACRPVQRADFRNKAFSYVCPPCFEKLPPPRAGGAARPGVMSTDKRTALLVETLARLGGRRAPVSMLRLIEATGWERATMERAVRFAVMRQAIRRVRFGQYMTPEVSA